MTECEAKHNIHCFICNNRAGVSIRNAVPIFNDVNTLPSSNKPLHETISEIVKKTINKNIHSHIICKKCYRLFQEYDEMQFRIEEIKTELLTQFKKTLTSYETDYKSFLSGTAVKIEPFKLKAVKSDKDKKIVTLPLTNLIKSPLKVLPVNNISTNPSAGGIMGIKDVKMASSIKKIRSLPPNVVILSRQGKKIALQKPNKPPPVILKLDKDDNSVTNPSLLVSKVKTEISSESITLKPKLLPGKKPQKTVLQQKTQRNNIVKLNTVRDPELDTSQDVQTDLVQQTDEENIQIKGDKQISQDNIQIRSKEYPLETLDYDEDSDGELDHVEDEEGSDNYVISHMEILDEHDSSSIELEEGTFLMEQAEDGSIIRVLHHPSAMYGKEDSEEGMNVDQQSESEIQNEEMHDNSTTINLNSIRNLGKKSFIRIKKSSTVVSDRSADKRGAYFVNGDSLDFDQMVKPVGDNTYHCLLCEVMKKKVKGEEHGEEQGEDQGEEQEEDKDMKPSVLKSIEDLEDPEKADQVPEKADQDPEKADPDSEKADQDPEKADQDPEKADQDPEKADQEQEQEARDGGEGGEVVESFFGVSKVMMYHLRIIHNVRLHICEVCGEMFRRRGEFTRHMEEHAKQETGGYKCLPCEKDFDSVRLYHSHMKTNHSQQIKQHECSICGRKFGSRKLLEEHNNTHIGVRPYNCEICGKTFASKYTYQSHLKTHMDRPRPYTCAQCGKSFFTMQNLTQHEKTHLGIKDFVCNVCGKAFGTQHNLEVHGVVHTGYKPFVCRTCNKAFARRAEIRDHERTHTGERPYTCEICGSTFSQRSNLQSHKRATHFDDKRYKCRNCDKRFKRRRLLEYHIKASHTGERPYKCSTCDATFVYPEHFKKHLRIHSGEKPYKCEVCDKAFNSRDNRNAHRFIHSDKKPYECQYCGAGFMRKPLLYAHMQSQGHLSDKIVVNQPRLNGEFDASKLEGLGNTFILEDGQEVIINNMKEEVFSEGHSLVSDVTLSGGGSQHSQELHEEQQQHLVFQEEEEEEEEEHPQQKLFVRTHVKHGHIVVEGADSESKVLDEEETEEGEDSKELDDEEDTTSMDLIDSSRIQIIGCEDEVPHEMVEGADNNVRFFQIRMPNGEKGWVALNSCEEAT